MKDAIFKIKIKCLLLHVSSCEGKKKKNYYRKFAVDHVRFNIDFSSVRERRR